MKTILFLSGCLISLQLSAQSPNGAWICKNGRLSVLILIQDNYLTRTVFGPTEFVESAGGTFEIKNGLFSVSLEFDTAAGSSNAFDIEYEPNEDVLTADSLRFQRADDGSGPLAGIWQISGRKDKDGNFTEIKHTGTRKTVKLLTGSYFHWFAIDPGKNEFYGSGGGSYTFVNGRYTENIEFFSKDNSRAGDSLNFDDKIENGKWVHTGLNSKGQPLYEVWQRPE